MPNSVSDTSASATTRQSAAIATQVMNDLVKNQEFVTLLKSIVGDAIQEKLGVLLTSIEKVQGELLELKNDLAKKNSKVKTLEEKVLEQKQSISKLESSVNNMEQYSRRSCIRIFGLEEKRGENTDTLVSEVIRTKLGVSLDPMKDIDRSHRTGSVPEPSASSDQSSVKKPRPRPIIVKLNTYRKRREIITNRRKLKGSGIVIAEDLTQKNQKLFAQTRAAQKIKSAWTSDGRIIALISASNGKTMTKLITTEEDLEKFK